MEEDQAEDRVVEVERVVEREDRDQRHLDWHDHEADDGDEGPVAPRELDPGERVGGEARDQDGQDGRADRDLRRHEQRVSDRGVVEDHPVVRERRLARLREDVPPAARVRGRGGQERRDEETGGRDQPEDPDQEQEQVDRELRDPDGERLARLVAHCGLSHFGDRH